MVEDAQKLTMLMMMEYVTSDYQQKWIALHDYSESTNYHHVEHMYSPNSEGYVFGCIGQENLPSNTENRFFVATLNADKTLNTMTTIKMTGSGGSKF